MSEIRVNIADANGAINGELHGSFTDALLASLMAEPEIVDEFRTALTRFVKPTETWTPLGSFRKGENLESYDAGILAIDLTARVIGIESTYSNASMEGSVRVDSEFGDFADEDGYVYIPYRLPNDWRIVHGIPGFEGLAAVRRRERGSVRQADFRPILFGEPLFAFVLSELTNSEDLDSDGLFAVVHSKWLMTPRDELFGMTPRQVMFEKRRTIDFDLHTRSLQYSFTKLCPKPIPAEFHAYRYAGFGSHEIIVYYDFVREIIGFALNEIDNNKSQDENERITRLKIFAENWWQTPSDDFRRAPVRIVEAERKRLNLTLSAEECLIDDNCPCCIAMYEDFDTPVFWHLDGCNMDEQYEFSLYDTHEEWQAEQERFHQFDADFAAGKYDDLKDDFILDDTPPF